MSTFEKDYGIERIMQSKGFPLSEAWQNTLPTAHTH